jgi:AcrR family transcriptional regulator
VSSPAVTPKGAATRAFPLQIAAEVFAERGYAQTTMAQLIMRSGLSKGAFCFHFSSKEQLALAVIGEKQRQWIDSVLQAIGSEPCAFDQLRAVASALVKAHRDPSAFSVSRLTRDLSRVDRVSDVVRGYLRTWIGLVAGLIREAQTEDDLPESIDADDLAAVWLPRPTG